MACPHLAGNYFKSCSALRDAYVPSRFQMDEYCSSQWHSLCPLFRQRREKDQTGIGAARTGTTDAGQRTSRQ
jgi:hypothetical protein